MAASIPTEARHRLAHRLEAVLPAPIPGRVVPPENWHVTLRFLGAIDEVAHDRLLAALDEADLGPAFRLSWEALGAFPKPRRATVLWAGLGDGEEELTSLAGVVAEAVERSGLSPEDRPFSPHLTLSRIRPPRDVTALVDETPALAVRMTVDAIVVYESRLGRGAPTYLPLERFALE